MKASLSKSGGQLPGMPQQTLSVESSALSEQAKQELAQLVTAVRAAPPVEGRGPGSVRDGMSYTITVEEDNGEETVLRASDGPNMTRSYADLLGWLQRHGERK